MHTTHKHVLLEFWSSRNLHDFVNHTFISNSQACLCRHRLGTHPAQTQTVAHLGGMVASLREFAEKAHAEKMNGAEINATDDTQAHASYQEAILEGAKEYSEKDLEKTCHEDFKDGVGMWTDLPTISDHFKVEAGGALLASMVGKYYFRKRNRTQAIWANPKTTRVFGPWAAEQTTPYGIALLRRAPDNARNQVVTRASYEGGMYTKGFNLDGRSPMVLLPVPDELKWCDDLRSRLVYAAATCWEAWLAAKMKQPTNPQLTVSERTGFTGCIDLRAKTPRQIFVWCTREWNQYQSGAGFDLNQYVARIDEYGVGFKAFMKQNEWDWNCFGTGEASQDARTWRWLKEKYEHQNELRIKDIAEYNRSKAFIESMRQKKLLQVWQTMVDEKVDHRNSRHCIHACMRVSHRIDVTMKTKYTGADLLRPERRNHMLMILLKCCLPLVGDTQSRYLWSKEADALKVERWLQLSLTYKPKPVAALMAASSVAAAAKPKKKPRAKAKSAAKEDNDDKDVTDDAKSPVVVADPKPITAKVLKVISDLVDEGLWQLMSRTPPVNIDEDEECVPKIQDLLALGIHVAASEGPCCIDVGNGENVTSLKEFRAYVFERLGHFSRGYVAIKSWKPLPEPTLDSATIETVEADTAEAADDTKDVADFKVMNAFQAMAFLKFCKNTWRSASSSVSISLDSIGLREAEASMLSWRIGLNNVTLEDVTQQVCVALSTQLDTAWIAEASLMFKAKDRYENFFSSLCELRRFLQVRTNVVFQLLRVCIPWTQHEFPFSLVTPEATAMIAAADASIATLVDLQTFWTTLVRFVIDYGNKQQADKETRPFMDDLQDFLVDINSFFGIETAADDGDGLEASASTGAANADCADVVCSIGRETVSLSNPECHCVTLLKLSCEKVRKTGIHGSP